MPMIPAIAPSTLIDGMRSPGGSFHERRLAMTRVFESVRPAHAAPKSPVRSTTHRAVVPCRSALSIWVAIPPVTPASLAASSFERWSPTKPRMPTTTRVIGTKNKKNAQPTAAPTIAASVSRSRS